MAGEPWRSRKSPLECVVAVLIIVSWLANAGIVASTAFVMIHWSAVDWMIGPSAWSMFLQIVTGVVLSFTCLLGCCILGFRQHIERSYLGLRTSPKARVFFMYLVPLLVICLFVTFTFLAFSDTDASTTYIANYSNNLFDRALALRKNDDLPKDAVFYDDFLSLMCSIYQIQNECTDSGFSAHIQRLFNHISRYGASIKRPDMFKAVLESVQPSRNSFGTATLFAALISLAFTIYYHGWYRYLQRTRFEDKLRMLKTQAGIYAMSHDDIEAAPLNHSEGGVYEFFNGFEEDFDDDEDVPTTAGT